MVCALTREIFSPNDRLYLQNVPISHVAETIQLTDLCWRDVHVICKGLMQMASTCECLCCVLNLIIKILHEMPRFFQAAFIPKLALYSQFSSFFQTLDLRVFNKTRIATRGPSQLLGHRCKNSSMLCCCSLEASESTNFSTL